MKYTRELLSLVYPHVILFDETDIAYRRQMTITGGLPYRGTRHGMAFREEYHRTERLDKALELFEYEAGMPINPTRKYPRGGVRFRRKSDALLFKMSY